MRSSTAPAGDLLDAARRRVRAGDIAHALDELTELDRAVGNDPAALDDPGHAALLTTTLECRLARGEIGEALTLAGRLTPYLSGRGTTGACAHLGRGEIAVATGETQPARDHFAEAGSRATAGDASADDPGELPWRVGAALAEVRLGNRAAGAALAHEQLDIARAAESAYGTALGLRTVATVDAGADGIGLVREALDRLRVEPAARLTAQLQTDLAGLLQLGCGAAPSVEALTLLRRAEEYVLREALWPLHGRVHRLLVRLDQVPCPLPALGLSRLTAGEQRVARLAVDGLTNRDIAQQLAVTVKAVEWHLSRTYRKLGIASRHGLASALGWSTSLG